MFTKKGFLKHAKFSGFITLGAVIAGTVIYLLTRFWTSFAQGVYVPYSRFVSGLLGLITSFAPISIAEMIIYALLFFFTVYLIVAIVFLIRRKTYYGLLRWIFDGVLSIAWIFFFFMLFWGGNYHTAKLDQTLELEMISRPEESLIQTTEWLLSQIQETAYLVPRDEKGVVNAGGFDELASQAKDCVEAMKASSPELIGKAMISSPKKVLASPLMSYFAISGIYIPLTGECNVSTITIDAYMPATMVHEMAHRLGYAPEEDANFFAYLACSKSENPVFKYSGALLAYDYCYSKITDAEVKADIRSRLPGVVYADYQYAYEQSEKYRGSGNGEKFSAVTNNYYLQAMSQPEGVQSYSGVVGLMVAYHAKIFGEQGAQ